MTEQQIAQRKQFLQSIKENPCEAINHYAYADWLEENGFNDDEANIHRNWTLESYQEAELFLMQFADELDETIDWLINKTIIKLNSNDPNCLIELGWHYTPKFVLENMDNFWKHFMVFAGIPIPQNQSKDNFFSGCCGINADGDEY